LKDNHSFDSIVTHPAALEILIRALLSIARLAVTLAIALLVISPAGTAQAVEIAPFLGHRYGGYFEDANSGASFEVADATAYGLVLDFDLEPGRQIELFLSRQDTQLETAGTFTGSPLFDLTIDYYHIGGLYMLPGNGRVRPFLTGSFGLTRMDPHRSDLNPENRFSLALGGGAKFFFTRSLGVRFDVRGIYTALNSDSAVFCSGGCVIKVNSSGFSQAELSAALMLRY